MDGKCSPSVNIIELVLYFATKISQFIMYAFLGGGSSGGGSSSNTNNNNSKKKEKKNKVNSSKA